MVRLKRLPQLTARALLPLLALFCLSCRAESIPPPPEPVDLSAPPKRGGALVLAFGEDLQTLDPARAIDSVSLFAAALVFDTLLDYSRDRAPSRAALVPSLASRFESSMDGLTLSFDIRKDARYSNGDPVLADDFVFSFDRLLAPETFSPVAQLFSVIEGAAERLEGKTKTLRGVEARGPRSLVIRLTRPDPTFPLLLALPQTTPLKRASVETKDAKPLGTGPFLLREYRPGQEMVFDRNPFYWDKPKPYLDSVRVKLGLPRDTMMLGFLRGDIDLLDGRICNDALLVAREKAWAPFVEKKPLFVVTADLMNNRKKPFDDKRTRQAFNYAINKEDSARLSNGRVMPANGFLTPGMPAYNPTRKVWPHDPARARALLAEAGYAEGLEVTYTTLIDEMAQKIALSMQADLAEVGVRMNIETLTFPAYLSSLGRGDLDFAFSSWSMDFPDPSNFLEVKFHSRMIDSGANDTGYHNPEVDRLLDEAKGEQDEARRLDLYGRAEDMIVEDCPNIWHFFTLAVDVRRPRVRGPIRHPARDYFFKDTYLVGD